MNKIIIGIHGLGNKPHQILLKRWWKKALLEGLKDIRSGRLIIPFHMVYWADVLHEKSLKPWIRDREHPQYLEEPYSKSPGHERPKVSRWRTSVYKYIEQQLDKIFLNADMTLNYGRVNDAIIRRYFKDLDSYYAGKPSIMDPERPARDVIHERLQSVLKKYRKKDILLIAHSMGSIVAYDVLTQAPESIRIHTFVTIGSPLGLPAVVSRIFSRQKEGAEKDPRLRAPDNITKHWYNLSDLEDRVALDHTLADDYLPNSQGVQAVDIKVYNDYMINNRRNPHKSYGYLRTPEMAGIIESFLAEEKIQYLNKAYRRVRRFIGQLNQRFLGSR